MPKVVRVDIADMNDPIKTIASKVVSTTADALSAPSRAVSGMRGAVADFQRSQVVGKRNFAGRTDNTNYYKGMGYWAKNKN